MKKYVVGMLFGFALSFAVGAHAEVKNMIDSVVQGVFPVTVDGKKLDSDAVVIDGSTYLPVRAFGEAIGYQVGFNSELGVSLTKTVESLPDNIVTKPSVVDPQKLIKRLEDSISAKKSDIIGLTATINNTDKSDLHYQEFVDRLAKYEAQLAELEKQKAELSK